MAGKSLIRWAIVFGAGFGLAGCEMDNPLAKLGGSPSESAAGERSTRLVERDVEAPEAFSAKGPGLWDGRPSLGGVWVATPDVKDPERVIVRNSANGKFVVGALFRRERELAGPKIQVSSDAAEALGMLAGAPADLSIVALRHADGGEADAMPDAAAPAGEDDIAAAPLATPAPRAPGDEPAAGGAALARDAGAALAAAAPEAAAESATAAARPAAKAAGGLSRPFIQLGIFSVEANAESTRAKLETAGVPAKTAVENWQGKTFWRVLAGPAGSESERSAFLSKIKGMGFPDAYIVAK